MSKPMTRAQLRAAVAAYRRHGTESAAADALGLTRTTFQHRLREAIRRKIRGAPQGDRRKRLTDTDLRAAVRAAKRADSRRAAAARIGMPLRTLQNRIHAAKARGLAEDMDAGPERAETMLGMLRKRPVTLAELARIGGITQGRALDWIEARIAAGINILRQGDRFSIEKSMAPAFVGGPSFDYVSRPDNTFRFLSLGDTHLGSKYERLDVLEDLYDRAAAWGADRALHTGNWIDGVSSFNAHDLKVYGMEDQLAYLAKHYPSRDGITTYAVAGEDHEGWFSRREGIDIGKRAEQTMRDLGRADWVNLGFMESHVRLVNANSGKEAILAVVHPGGGSAYALSYSVQKIIEALEGGEKPAVALYGHYHKLWAGNIRNVWVQQTGCTQDQTVFTRNKVKQEVHVGGILTELEQDPRTGAIVAMTAKICRYFVRGYYNDRWRKSGAVVLPDRRPEPPPARRVA